jgi:hypothetical protein
MNFTEAVAHFNNSRRKMAYALDISIQAIQYWAKDPAKDIPKKRVEQIEEILIKRRQAETIPQGE